MNMNVFLSQYNILYRLGLKTLQIKLKPQIRPIIKTYVQKLFSCQTVEHEFMHQNVKFAFSYLISFVLYRAGSCTTSFT